MKTPKSSPLLQGAACALSVAVSLVSGPVCAHAGIDEQIRDLTARIADAPSAELYVRRAELHRLHREWAAAEADLLAAVELDVRYPDVHLELGELRLDVGQPERAAFALDVYLELRPDSSRGHAARARAMSALGRPLEAAAAWDRAIANASDGLAGPGYYLERARALAEAGPEHLTTALAGLDAGLAALGQPVTLQLYAVELEVQRKSWDTALGRLDRIAAHSARQETWLLRRGEILEQAGRTDDALAAYRGALRAIDALPQGRRTSRAMQRVTVAAQEGVGRLARPGADGQDDDAGEAG